MHQVCAKVNKEAFLEVTVENDAALDLSEFSVATHGGVLLDGVGDPLVLKRAREVLQGRPKVTWGGRSATMRYAYPYTLCRRGVVATFDLSATGLDVLKTDHWLADERNVIQLWLTSPAWEDGDERADEAMVEIEPRDAMMRWTVDETAQFLKTRDLRGPACVCEQSGVNGADLMELTEKTFVSDLHLSPFAARKVVAARDSFLA